MPIEKEPVGKGKDGEGKAAEPGPTIVGPRPAEGAGGPTRTAVGLERLLALAGLGGDWRAKVLADPVKASEEAGIELSEGELRVLKSIAPEALAGMAASMGKSRRAGLRMPLAAAGTAAAALLASELCGCYPGPGPVGGARPDEPASCPELLGRSGRGPRAVHEALAEAAASNRAVMVCVDCTGTDYLCAELARTKELLAVALPAPAPGSAVERDYLAFLGMHGVGRAPAVLFLAPDGSLLRKTGDDPRLVRSLIRSMPQAMADWAAKRRQSGPGP